jgi:hypothetical protein
MWNRWLTDVEAFCGVDEVRISRITDHGLVIVLAGRHPIRLGFWLGQGGRKKAWWRVLGPGSSPDITSMYAAWITGYWITNNTVAGKSTKTISSRSFLFCMNLF